MFEVDRSKLRWELRQRPRRRERQIALLGQTPSLSRWRDLRCHRDGIRALGTAGV